MPNKGSLFVSRQVFYLVDDVLILALGPEVHRKSDDGSNNAANAAAPKEGVVCSASLNLIGLVHKPAHEKDNAGNTEEEPVGIELLGAGHTATNIQEIVGHQIRIADIPTVIIGGSYANQHEDAGKKPEGDRET